MRTDPRDWKARFPLTVGFLAVTFLVGGLGLWSVGTEISGAVVASGTVKVENDRQVVQHPDGGVVGAIRVRNGDRVKVGDVLIELDDTFVRSELAIIERQLFESYVRRARLRAERDNLDALAYDHLPELSKVDDGWKEQQIAGQLRLFDARRASLTQSTAQLAEKRRQVENRISGLEAQLDGQVRQREILSAEVLDLDSLLKKGLIQAGRVLEMKRDLAAMDGEIGRLTAEIAASKTEIATINIEVIALRDLRREEAITQIRDLRHADIELAERQLSLTERLTRLEVRAPIEGTVFDSRVFAEKSVIRSADPIMFLVPSAQPLQVQVRIAPTDIDQVFTGQPVSLKFPTFDMRTTPEVEGHVSFLSADAKSDEGNQTTYYEAVVVPSEAGMAELADVDLVPGMPVEAFLRTSDPTPLSYLTRPLAIYFDRAFRES